MSLSVRIARVYLRVSTESQDIARQEAVAHDARSAGWYVAGVYRETASGTLAARPELQRLIADLQPGEVVIAEKLDRISRLPLPDAEKLIASIRAKGARLCVPGLIDLSEIAGTGVTRIVLDAMEEMLLRIALQTARDDYEVRRDRQQQGIAKAKENGIYKGRAADTTTHENIIEHRSAGKTIAQTAKLAKCSPSQVKLVWAAHKAAKQTATTE